MARLPCYVIPGQPQHIIQRGNNREPIFADESDYLFYIECLKKAVITSLQTSGPNWHNLNRSFSPETPLVEVHQEIGFL